MAKEKRRNSEKRKEKSRDAARFRRSKETEIFTELANCLPMPESVAQQLDKASVMRLAISMLKIGDILEAVGIADDREGQNSGGNKAVLGSRKTRGKMNGNGSAHRKDAISESQTSQMYLKALEGMVFILSHDGDIVYLSENVLKYLGLQQIEVMGQSIYDYIHPCDHEEVKEAMNTKNSGTQEVPKQSKEDVDSLLLGNIVNFSIRMKCTLTSKGRSVNLKSAPYKVMKCCGRLVSSGHQDKKYHDDMSRPYLLVMMEPIPHPSNIEVPLDSSTFLSKHEMDMRFLFCDSRIEELAGYDHKAMEGQSFFDFQHALDSEAIKKTFKDLFAKGQAVTQAYRMLVAKGGYIWLVTQATTINNNRNQRPQSVVCVHYVLSGVEEKGVILSNIQELLTLPAPATTVTPPPSPMALPTAPLMPSQHQPKFDLLPPKVELSTESILSPKSCDMDKNLYKSPVTTPYEGMGGDEFVGLSPTAGEDSVLLPFNAYKTDFLASPMMVMPKSPSGALKQEPGLLSPEQCYGKSLTPSPSPMECSRVASPEDYLSCEMLTEMDSMDKFFASINPRDGENNGCNLQSSVSPPLAITEVNEMNDDEMAEIDFAMRAPYIPMDRDEDLNLLPPSSSTLFNLSKDDINPSVFGRTEFVFGPKQALFEEPKPTQKVSVRDMLGESTAVASIKQPPMTTYLQMKRSLDMNCLEKGPPQSKVARLETPDVQPLAAAVQSCQKSAGNGAENKNSVLLNLLLNGEDRNYGYKVAHKLQDIQSTDKTKYQQSNKFETLTNQDCEVNAPVKSANLLQGQEILKALDR